MKMSKDEFVMTAILEQGREPFGNYWQDQYDLFMSGYKGPDLHDLTLLLLL